MRKIEWQRAVFYRLRGFWSFLYKHHKMAIGVFFIGLVIVLFVCHTQPELWKKTDKMGVLFTFVNTMAIIFLWMAGVVRQWRESLPLYEIAVLEDERGMPLMMVMPVPLISEGDARAQAQTALNVWNGAKKLPLKQWVNRRDELGEWYDRSGLFNEGRPVRLLLVIIRKAEDLNEEEKWIPCHSVDEGYTRVYLVESHALKEVPDQPIRLRHEEVKSWYQAPQLLNLEITGDTPQNL